MNYFEYNGVRSTAFGIRIEKKNVYSAPKYNVTFQSVPGRNGDLILPGGRYPNIDISYTVFIPAKSQGELAEKTIAVKRWLYADQNSYHILSDSYDKDHYRKAVYVSKLDISDTLGKIGRCKISFSCMPFKYLNSGQVEQRLPGSGATLTNPSPFTSKPYIKIFGSGNVTFTLVNGSDTKTWSIEGLTSYIEADSEIMNFYKGSALMNGSVTGEGFPELKPGTTRIAYSSGITEVRVIPRWVTI